MERRLRFEVDDSSLQIWRAGLRVQKLEGHRAWSLNNLRARTLRIHEREGLKPRWRGLRLTPFPLKYKPDSRLQKWRLV